SLAAKASSPPSRRVNSVVVCSRLASTNSASPCQEKRWRESASSGFGSLFGSSFNESTSVRQSSIVELKTYWPSTRAKHGLKLKRLPPSLALFFSFSTNR